MRNLTDTQSSTPKPQAWIFAAIDAFIASMPPHAHWDSPDRQPRPQRLQIAFCGKEGYCRGNAVNAEWEESEAVTSGAGRVSCGCLKEKGWRSPCMQTTLLGLPWEYRPPE